MISCLYASLAGLRLQSATLIRQGIHQCSNVGYNPVLWVDGPLLAVLPLLSTLLKQMQCGLPVCYVSQGFNQPAHLHCNVVASHQIESGQSDWSRWAVASCKPVDLSEGQSRKRKNPNLLPSLLPSHMLCSRFLAAGKLSKVPSNTVGLSNRNAWQHVECFLATTKLSQSCVVRSS